MVLRSEIIILTWLPLVICHRFFYQNEGGSFIELSDVETPGNYLTQQPETILRQLEEEEVVEEGGKMEGMGILDSLTRNNARRNIDTRSMRQPLMNTRNDPYGDDYYYDHLDHHDDGYYRDGAGAMSNRPRNHFPPLEPISNRYNDRQHPYDAQIPLCCQECRGGDIDCLSICDRRCIKGRTCNAAGLGAYAAFCQRSCPSNRMTGQSATDYLPLRACEGECAAEVQELCAANMCKDYGCVVRDCSKRAPRLCELN